MSSASAAARAPILPLPPGEVAKICAGEVVERPLSVVKELVENALDAGAGCIEVELEEGGRRLIRVGDDGCGIPPGELALAVSAHCTSKLRELDDLYRLGTLGFRGEALAAIGTVSRLSLASRWAGADTAAQLEVDGDRVSALRPSNLQRGTEVAVRDLFAGVPARLKFLRSAAAETAQVSGLLTGYALAYPEVRFTLRSGGRTLLETDGQGGLREALAGLLGAELAADLADIHFEYPPSAVYGCVTAPHRHFHNRTRQWFLVNRRPVSSKLLHKAVDDALREFVSPGRFPAGVFALELPPEEIDVNIHPSKAEVAFAQPQAVYALLLTGVRRALGEAAAQRQRSLTRGMSVVIQPTARLDSPTLTDNAAQSTLNAALQQLANADLSAAPLLLESATEPLDDGSLAPPGSRAVPVYGPGDRIAPPDPPAVGEAFDTTIEFVRADRTSEQTERFAEVPTADHSQASPDPASAATVPPVPEAARIQQVADTYLVLVTAGEVYLIDQHSAHERILFEDLWARLGDGGALAASQQLLFESAVRLSPAEAALAEELLPALGALGFAARLADQTLHVSAVPALLAARATPELIAAVLADLSAGAADLHDAGGHLRDAATALGGAVKQLLATLACKAAVKAGQPLAEAERVELARLICARWSSLTCPHGRPTVVRLGEGELQRLFLRT